LRGNKADIFEGGHRVAFVARWPAVIKPKTDCAATICHTDLLATAAEITGFEIPANAGEDSVSILPLLKQSRDEVREATVHHSINGSFAIRQGKWKLVLCPGSGGWSAPRPPQARQQKLPATQLFDLAADLGEKKNLAAEHPDVVRRLTTLLQRYADQGRSTPGPKQKNDSTVRIVKK
jgi:arylsulfatase A-like enzyme